MNAELDPLLNAYLDGELNAPGRRRVERASRSDPAISDRLQALARTRDLVATLSSPGPVDDVSGEVLATLSERAEVRRRSWRRSTIAASALVPAMAASLLVVFGRPPAPAKVDPGGHPQESLVMAARPSPASPSRPGLRPSAKPSAMVLAPGRAIDPSALAREMRAIRDQDDYNALVRAGELRRIDVTVDRYGPSTEDSLETAIRTTNFHEPRHARFRLVQDVKFGPDSPSPSCALVVVMDQYEHENFRKHLEELFPNSVSEAGDRPTSDTLRSLAEVGRMEILITEPRGTLMPPPADAPKEVAVRLPKLGERREEIVNRRSGEVVAATARPPRPAAPAAVRRPSGEPRPAVYVVVVTGRWPSRN